MAQESIYVNHRAVTDIKDCSFYHTMELPGHGTVEGAWDFRNHEQEYLGSVNFVGKRVLELGTASGFFCFYMEKMGAEVIGYDLSDGTAWDIVPYANIDQSKILSERRETIEKLHNGYWFSHRLLKSTAKVVYGSIYEIPKQIGPVDIATFGCILLHLRDPFLALQNALQLTTETVIITEPNPISTIKPKGLKSFLKNLLNPAIPPKPTMQFIPNYRQNWPYETWWQLPSEVIIEMIGIFGFTNIQVTYHTQKLSGVDQSLYTVVGHKPK